MGCGMGIELVFVVSSVISMGSDWLNETCCLPPSQSCEGDPELLGGILGSDQGHLADPICPLTLTIEKKSSKSNIPHSDIMPICIQNIYFG
jgi:hypothetical protein